MHHAFSAWQRSLLLASASSCPQLQGNPVIRAKSYHVCEPRNPVRSSTTLPTEGNSIGQAIIFILSVMARSTPIANRPSGHDGSHLPPSRGGGDDGRSGDSMPNYGQRLRRARLALAVFLAPILMLFVSFTVVYLIRRGFVSFDVASDTYIRTWVPVRLPWLVLVA